MSIYLTQYQEKNGKKLVYSTYIISKELVLDGANEM